MRRALTWHGGCASLTRPTEMMRPRVNLARRLRFAYPPYGNDAPAR
ncbi:hypothetical protein CSE899_00135 [Cronobacter sakazakii E899]|nr:hypothetical protein CSE899_00135 [Cronobacter sakazakii E899]